MKKIKKNDLRLEKEVISALTESDLGSVKGGLVTNTCNCTPETGPSIVPVSKPMCKTDILGDCKPNKSFANYCTTVIVESHYIDCRPPVSAQKTCFDCPVLPIE